MHTHTSNASSQAIAKLQWALILTTIIFIIEFLGGLASHSLSVLSNSVHMLSDIGAMALAYYAARVQANPPTSQLSYGYRRSGTLAALINGLVLGILAAALIAAGLYRLARPAPVQAGPMIWLGILALIFNAAVSGLLMRHEEHDLNTRSMLWHSLGDGAGSFSVILSGLLVLWTHWDGFDALAGIAIGAILLKASWTISRHSVNILMEGTPPDVDPDRIEEAVRNLPEITDVHHLHIWTLGSGYNVLSAHVRTRDMSLRDGQHLLLAISTEIKSSFPIHHVTIQLETDAHDEPDDDCTPLQ